MIRRRAAWIALVFGVIIGMSLSCTEDDLSGPEGLAHSEVRFNLGTLTGASECVAPAATVILEVTDKDGPREPITGEFVSQSEDLVFDLTVRKGTVSFKARIMTDDNNKTVLWSGERTTTVNKDGFTVPVPLDPQTGILLVCDGPIKLTDTRRSAPLRFRNVGSRSLVATITGLRRALSPSSAVICTDDARTCLEFSTLRTQSIAPGGSETVSVSLPHGMPIDDAIVTVIIQQEPTDDRGSPPMGFVGRVPIQIQTVGFNRPPIPNVAKLPPTLSACDGASAPVTLDGSASTDPDRDKIKLYVWSVDGREIARSDTAKLVRELAVGPHAITLTVIDDRDEPASAPEEVTITVTSTNRLPVANAGDDQSSVVDDDRNGFELVRLDGSKSMDLDGMILSYVWSEFGIPITEPSEDPTANVDLKVGTHTITLTVTDNCGPRPPQPTDTVDIEVNQPPIARAGRDTMVVDSDKDGFEPVTLNGSTSTDDEGIVRYAWSEGGVPIAEPSEDPTANVNLLVGTHAITLTVTDNDGLTDTDDIMIMVKQPPTADAGDDKTVPNSSGGGLETVRLDGSKSMDLDGMIVRYEWMDMGTGETLAVAETDTVSVDLVVGTHEIALTVIDNDSLADMDKVVHTVLPDSSSCVDNMAPVANAGRDQAVVDDDRDGVEMVQLDGSKSTDLDGIIVRYKWMDMGTGETLAVTKTDTVKLSVGTHRIRLTVTDDCLDTAFDDVTIMVNQVQLNADAGRDSTATDSDNSGFEKVTLNGSASTPSEAIVTYEWKDIATRETLSVSDSSKADVELAVGTHLIELTVVDNDGRSDTDQVIHTVSPGPPKTITFAGIDPDSLNPVVPVPTGTVMTAAMAESCENVARIYDTRRHTADPDLNHQSGQGEVLIIEEDLGDGDRDGDPDDCSSGGTLTLDFSGVGPHGTVTLISAKFLDIEEEVGNSVKLFDSGGNLLRPPFDIGRTRNGEFGPPKDPGDGGIGTLDLGSTKGVRKMIITLVESAAVDDIVCKPDI